MDYYFNNQILDLIFKLVEYDKYFYRFEDDCDYINSNIIELLIKNNSIDKFKIILDLDYFEKFEINDALSEACIQGNISFVRFLLENGADINYKNKEKHRTALMCACRYGHIEIVKFLIENGASINDKKTNKNTALLFACRNNYIEIVKILLENKAIINTNEFCSACLNGHVEIAKLLIDNGADVNAQSYKFYTSMTPLMYACKFNQINVVKLLLANGANINEITNCEETCLFYTENYDILRILIENKVDINYIPSNKYTTALIKATTNNKYEIVELLILNGADKDLCNYKGYTAFEIAKRNKFQKIIDLFKKLE